MVIYASCSERGGCEGKAHAKEFEKDRKKYLTNRPPFGILIKLSGREGKRAGTGKNFLEKKEEKG